MRCGRRLPDTWRVRLIWGGAVLQVVLFVLNAIATGLFLRAWAALESSVADLQEVSRRARERLDEPQVKPWGL